MKPPKITKAEAEELLERDPLDTSHRPYTEAEQANIAEIARLRHNERNLLEALDADAVGIAQLRQDKAELVERAEKMRAALRRAEEFLDNTNYTNPPDPPLLCHFCKASEYNGQEGVIHKDNCLITELRAALANARKES